MHKLDILESHNPDEEITSIIEISTATEGKKKFIYAPVYERKPQNRDACIKHNGATCKVCGFNFEKRYGILGADFIEVHHKIPLSSLSEEIEINPVEDLIPVCSNCHRMLHRKKVVF